MLFHEVSLFVQGSPLFLNCNPTDNLYLSLIVSSYLLLAAILPILNSGSNEYKGLEYLGIYPYIDYNASTNGKYEFWVNDPKDRNKYTVLREWLETGKLKDHNAN